MKNRRGVFPVISFCFLLFPILAMAEPNQPTVRMLHIFVRMDENKITFENIWVFERQQANYPWDVSIDLPDGATVMGIDEPNETEFLEKSRVVHKKMFADSPIGTVGFSFILPMQGDVCQTLIKPRYDIGSMVVFLSKPAVRLESNVLKLSESLTAGSGYAGVYTAGSLPAGAKIEINLKSLPTAGGRLFEIICLAGFSFIAIMALIILRRSRGAV
jgi:hypothetical protein